MQRVRGRMVRTLCGFGLAGALAVGGCTGSISGAPTGSGPGQQNPGDPPTSHPPDWKPDDGTNPPPPPPPPPAGVTAGEAPLRRLTAEQYRNTVRDLLGIRDALPAVTALPGDETIAERFTSNTVRPVQGVDLDRYGEVAESLARAAVANAAAVQALVPCDLKTGDAACAKKFIETFGMRAYRRPLSPDEVTRALKLYEAGRANGGDFANAIRMVLQGILQSVNFLYLFEQAPGVEAGKIVALDHYAMASRLSYFFLNSMPDEGLFKAAAAAQLGTAEQIEKEATRLLSDDRARDVLATFHRELLELGDLKGAEKDAMLFPAWNDTLRAALQEETRRFVDHVMKQGDGKLETLLTARYSFLSGPLYDLYGVAKPAGGDAALNEWRKTDLNPKERAGLLTQGGLLATLAREDRTSFVRRGKMVSEAFLCKEVADPPPNVNDSEGMIPATKTARERAALHRERPDCAACHDTFDPLGFAFESYDAIGRFRAGVDSSADVIDTQKLDGRVENAVGLIEKLAGQDSDEVRDCFVKQWLRFALGHEDGKEDKASVQRALEDFRASGWKVPSLLVAVARSDSFRHQKVKQ